MSQVPYPGFCDRFTQSLLRLPIGAPRVEIFSAVRVERQQPAASSGLSTIDDREMAKKSLASTPFGREIVTMQRWPLTKEQIQTEPWGLPENLLSPAKCITDPIQGDVFLNQLEVELLDSPPMQRLRRLRQLGTTPLVYPGATHTRFSHSIGALQAAQNLLDSAVTQRFGPHPTRDLFSTWTSKELETGLPEATVLVRLGALLHDICHVSYGHTVEDELKVLVPHDENEERFERIWDSFDEVNKYLAPIKDELKAIILSEGGFAKSFFDSGKSKYRFAKDIVGNTVCADLFDYLDRDHRFTGLPFNVGTRFTANIYVVPTDHAYHANRVAIRLQQSGGRRSDIETELFKLLRYRYELTERVLTHHAKLSADAMLGRLFREFEIGVEKETTKTGSDLSEETRSRLEVLLYKKGDDGILEHFASLKDPFRRVAQIADALLNRRLHKTLARSFGSQPSKNPIHQAFGTPKDRFRLTENAANFIGCDPAEVLLWIPPPKMRLKVAEVLIDDGKNICTLDDRDRLGDRRGREITENHERLWAVSLFTSKRIRDDPDKSKILRAYVAERMGLTWDTAENVSIDELLVGEAANATGVPAVDIRRLPDIQTAARDTGGGTYADRLRVLVAQVNETAHPEANETAHPEAVADEGPTGE